VRLGWRATAIAGAAAVAVVLALSPLGRSERSDSNRTQVRGIARINSAVTGREPVAYRLTGWGDCLLWSEGPDPYALELCYDGYGRGIEAIDRHDRGNVKIFSIRYDPGLSATREAPQSLFDTLKRMGAFPKSVRFEGVLPLADAVALAPETEGDSGPILAHE
jgi:hypothetical protein